MTTLQTPLTIAAAVTASATLTPGKHVPVDATAGAVTMTLPTPATIGARVRVEKIDTSANAVTVTGQIRGVTLSIPMTSQYESREFFAESLTSWRPSADHRTTAAQDARYDAAGAAAAATTASALDSATATNVTSGAATSAALRAAYAPILSAKGLAAKSALAEAAVAAGAIPPRMSPAPTTYGATKGSGITGTPTVSAGGSGYVVGDQITLAGGTALVPAILQVATVSAGAVATVTVVRNGIYTATPANAVAQASTTGAGTGATFTVSWSTGGMSISLSRQQIGPTDARYRFTGPGPTPTNESGSGFYGSSFNGAHSTFEWATDSQRVDIKLIGINTNGVLYVDGKQVSAAQITTDASASNYIYSIDLGSAVMRSFKWVAFNNGFGGVYLDGTATLIAPFAALPPLAWSMGDSYTLGTGADNVASQHVMVMADQLGLDVLPDGVGGSGWLTTGINVPATRIANRLALLPRVPDYVFFDLGYNDAGGDMNALATAFDAAATAAKSAAPNAKYVVFGPATPLGSTTNLDAVRTALIARAAAWGMTFVDVRNWVSATNSAVYTGGDNTHPTARGHKYLGARRAEVLKPLL